MDDGVAEPPALEPQLERSRGRDRHPVADRRGDACVERSTGWPGWGTTRRAGTPCAGSGDPFHRGSRVYRAKRGDRGFDRGCCRRGSGFDAGDDLGAPAPTADSAPGAQDDRGCAGDDVAPCGAR